MLTGKLGKKLIESKRIFYKAIEVYAQGEEPTRENCRKPLALKLLDYRDKMFEMNEDYWLIQNKRSMNLIRNAWKIVIREVEHNDEYLPYWESLINIVKEDNDVP